MTQSSLYEQDFFAWSHQQAAILRSGNLAQADMKHIAEEIESMGNAEKRELASRSRLVLLHLLKWQFQPLRRSASWEATIRVQRRDLQDHLVDNPSLKSRLGETLDRAYGTAALEAVAETGLALSTFPPTCPYSAEQVLDEAYWPTAP